MDAQDSDEELRCSRQTHQLYEAYVEAARDYFKQPTSINWERKEEAFELYNECISVANNYNKQI
jgi:hypothetical protein